MKKLLHTLLIIVFFAACTDESDEIQALELNSESGANDIELNFQSDGETLEQGSSTCYNEIDNGTIDTQSNSHTTDYFARWEYGLGIFCQPVPEIVFTLYDGGYFVGQLYNHYNLVVNATNLWVPIPKVPYFGSNFKMKLNDISANNTLTIDNGTIIDDIVDLKVTKFGQSQEDISTATFKVGDVVTFDAQAARHTSAWFNYAVKLKFDATGEVWTLFDDVTNLSAKDPNGLGESVVRHLVCGTQYNNTNMRVQVYHHNVLIKEYVKNLNPITFFEAIVLCDNS